MESQEAPDQPKPPQERDEDMDEEFGEVEQEDLPDVNPLNYDDANEYIKALQEHARLEHRKGTGREQANWKKIPEIADPYVPQHVREYARNMKKHLERSKKSFGRNIDYQNAIQTLDDIENTCSRLLSYSHSYRNRAKGDQGGSWLQKMQDTYTRLQEGSLGHSIEYDRTWLEAWAQEQHTEQPAPQPRVPPQSVNLEHPKGDKQDPWPGRWVRKWFPPPGGSKNTGQQKFKVKWARVIHDQKLLAEGWRPTAIYKTKYQHGTVVDLSKRPEARQKRVHFAPPKTGQVMGQLWAKSHSTTLDNILDQYDSLIKQTEEINRKFHPIHAKLIREFSNKIKAPGHRKGHPRKMNIFAWYTKLKEQQGQSPGDLSYVKQKQQVRTMIHRFEQFRQKWNQANLQESVDYETDEEEEDFPEEYKPDPPKRKEDPPPPKRKEEEEEWTESEEDPPPKRKKADDESSEWTESDERPDQFDERAHIDTWRDIKGDLEQGFQRGGKIINWPQVIEDIMKRLPLSEAGLTKAKVSKAFELNFYNLFYNRYKGRGYQVRPSDMFHTPINTESRQIQPKSFRAWNKKIFSFMGKHKFKHGKKNVYLKYVFDTLQDNKAYDEFVSQYGKNIKPPVEHESKIIFKDVVRELLINPPKADVFGGIIHRIRDASEQHWNDRAIRTILAELDDVADPTSKHFEHILMNALEVSNPNVLRGTFTEASLKKSPATLMKFLRTELIESIVKEQQNLRKQYISEPLSAEEIQDLERFQFPESGNPLHKVIRDLNQVIIESSKVGLERKQQSSLSAPHIRFHVPSSVEDLREMERELAKKKEYLLSLEAQILEIKRDLSKHYSAGNVPKASIEDYHLEDYIREQQNDGGALQEIMQEHRKLNAEYARYSQFIDYQKRRFKPEEPPKQEEEKQPDQEDEKQLEKGVPAIPDPGIPPTPESIRVVPANPLQIGMQSPSPSEVSLTSTIAYIDPGGTVDFQGQLDRIKEEELDLEIPHLNYVQPQHMDPRQIQVDRLHFPMSGEEKTNEDNKWDEFIKRKGFSVLKEDFYYDRIQDAIRPITKAHKSYSRRIPKTDEPYEIPANHIEEVAYVHKPPIYSKYDPEQISERFLEEQRKTPLFKAAKKATTIGDYIHVKLYPHSIHFIFLKKPPRQAIEIMANRIVEQTDSTSNARLLSSRKEKGKKTIGTVIASRDLSRMKAFHIQNILARSRDRHFILRYDSSGGSMHERYDRNFHLL